MRHDVTDQISLAMGRMVAARLCQRPELIRVARENLDRWTRRNAEAPGLLRCYSEWQRILESPLDEICSLLCSDTEEARRLRQNSPFAGVLDPREVWELKQQFWHATATA